MRVLLAMFLLLATGAEAPVSAQAVVAQDASRQARIAEGRQIAETWCANCHLVGPGARGPVSDAAPPFHAVAAMASTTEMSLRAFLMTPHGPMPDFRLTGEQIEVVSNYILSLRQR